MSRILGLGGVTVDLIGVVDHIPRTDEVIRLQEYRMQQGGMVATALVAAARLGAETAFFGAVGDDQNGRFILDSFAAEGVDTTGVQVVSGGTSAFSFIMVEKDSGLRTIVHEPGVQAAAALGGLPGDPAELLSGVGYVHLDGFWMESAATLARKARQAKIPVTLDVGQNQKDPKIEVLLCLADYVIPSLAFARRYTGKDLPAQSSAALRESGAGAVIQTTGEQGAFVLPAEGPGFTVPAFKVPVVDTTGAGDSFHGGFLFALSRGYGLKEAVVVASAVAALKCTRPGGQSGLPSYGQLRRFLAERGDLLPDS